jgi:hypothetical protein
MTIPVPATISRTKIHVPGKTVTGMPINRSARYNVPALRIKITAPTLPDAVTMIRAENAETRINFPIHRANAALIIIQPYALPQLIASGTLNVAMAALARTKVQI